MVTEQPQNNNKVVIEAVADTDALFDNENVWPFHIITALLLNEIFEFVLHFPIQSSKKKIILIILQSHMGSKTQRGARIERNCKITRRRSW